MMKILSVMLLVFLTGCAAEQGKLDSVAARESAVLPMPSKPLSTFSSYELKPFILSDEVRSEDGKVQQAAVLEKKVKDELLPMFTEWTSAGGSGRAGKLIVQPEVVRLKVVGTGARFFAGAFAGESRIDVDLRLIDGSTNEEIAKARVTGDAGAFAGAWSIGKSDANLHDYVAHIIHKYLSDNFRPGHRMSQGSGGTDPAQAAHR